MWCTAGNDNNMSHISAKGFLDSNFIYAVIGKISNFQETAPNKFHIFTKIVIFKVWL